jgi:hypothetical protein
MQLEVLADEKSKKANLNPSSICNAERFDPEKNKWEEIAPMTECRRALSAVALPDGVYSIGGYSGKLYLSSVERYDPCLDEWVPVKDMNKSRCTFSAVTSSDCQHVYVIGGFDGSPLNSVERYDVVSDSWEDLPPISQKRFMHSVVMLTSASTNL